jgi:hypothetical protein
LHQKERQKKKTQYHGDDGAFVAHQQVANVLGITMLHGNFEPILSRVPKTRNVARSSKHISAERTKKRHLCNTLSSIFSVDKEDKKKKKKK